VTGNVCNRRAMNIYVEEWRKKIYLIIDGLTEYKRNACDIMIHIGE
jgi:hypothetical protein